MATITSTGLGSGLDIENLVTQLVAVEGGATRKRLDQREIELQTRLSAYGTLKGAVSSLQSSLGSLKNSAGFQSISAKSSDTDIASVSTNSAAAVGVYDLSVAQLAKSQRLVSDPSAGAAYTSLNDVVGTGNLTFSFGTVDYDTVTDTVNGFVANPDKADQTVAITDGSLTGIRDAVNEADIGVTAAIIYDGTHYRLSFTADDTGVANALQISVTDDDANNSDSAGLSQLNFNATTSFLTQNQAGQDAAVTLNGVAVTSASNTLSDTVQGLTFNLQAAGDTTVTVSKDASSITKSVTTFVESFNNLTRVMNQLDAYNPDTQQAGVLNGDATLRRLDIQLDRLLGTPVSGADSNYQILAQIGITRNTEDGTLDLDKAKLETAVKEDATAVVGLFSALGQPTDSLITYSSATKDTVPGEYAVDITQIATQGQLTGSQAANLTITANTNDTLSFQVDGIATTITLDAGTYTASSLAAHLQTRLNDSEDLLNNGVNVTVSESGGVLSIQSDRYGSASKVSVTGGNGSSDLLGASPTSSDGVDVAGTIGGFAATGSGQVLTGTGNVSGLSLTVAGGATGNRGTVNFTQGYAFQLDNFLAEVLSNDGVFKPLTDSITQRIQDINEDREVLSRRLSSLEARLRTQFNAMDQLVGQLQATSTFLQQQLEAIPRIQVSRNSN